MCSIRLRSSHVSSMSDRWWRSPPMPALTQTVNVDSMIGFRFKLDISFPLLLNEDTEWAVPKASNHSPIYATPFSTTQVTLQYRITSEFRKTTGWYWCYYWNLTHQAAHSCTSKKRNRGNGRRQVHPRVPGLYEPHMHIYSHPHRHTHTQVVMHSMGVWTVTKNA